MSAWQLVLLQAAALLPFYIFWALGGSTRPPRPKVKGLYFHLK